MAQGVADEKIKEAVRQRYGGIARRFVGEPGGAEEGRAEEQVWASCCCDSLSEQASASASCCGSSRVAIEEAVAEMTRSGCCGPSRASTEEAAVEMTRSSCCGSSRVATGEAAAETTRSGCCGSPSVATEEAVAEMTRSSCCGPSRGAAEEAAAETAQSSCCGPSDAVELSSEAARFYAEDELDGLPESVTDASLGCGDPVTIAELEPGEVVLDLGSGGGIDCFLAAKRVGPEGRAIGLDMTTDMIKLARRNAKKVGATNVDFRYGEMEDMPLADASVDVIISNCVINLSPDKDAVFREAYRVLRPGGRISVSDMVVDGDLPQFLRERMDAWAACIAGALDESVYVGKIRAAGFENVEIVSRRYSKIGQNLDASQELTKKVASIRVKAHKPA